MMGFIETTDARGRIGLIRLDNHTERTMKFCTVWLISIGMACMTGCGRSDSLSGTVTYNGQPVDMGSVTFDSADGHGPGFGAQVVNGKYQAVKVRRGQHVAHVRGLTKAPVLTHEESIKLREQRDNRYGLPVDYIPEKADGNGRSVEIEGGSQSLDFAVKGPPRSG
jgi:hypothetical protein